MTREIASHDRDSVLDSKRKGCYEYRKGSMHEPHGNRRGGNNIYLIFFCRGYPTDLSNSGTQPSFSNLGYVVVHDWRAGP